MVIPRRPLLHQGNAGFLSGKGADKAGAGHAAANYRDIIHSDSLPDYASATEAAVPAPAEYVGSE